MIPWLPSILASGSTPADSSLLWVRVLAYLGLLAASAYFLILFRKKKQMAAIQSKSGKIHVTDTCPLGNRQYLIVAQYGQEKHLLGVNPTSIAHLSRLNSTDSPLEHPKSNSSDEN